MIVTIDTLRQTYSISKSISDENICATELSLLLEIDTRKDHWGGNLTIKTDGKVKLNQGSPTEAKLNAQT